MYLVLCPDDANIKQSLCFLKLLIIGSLGDDKSMAGRDWEAVHDRNGVGVGRDYARGVEGAEGIG